MELWNKARSFAEEAAKRSQELTKEAADLTLGYSKLSDFVSDASKRSKEIAAEASKRADLLRAEAAKRADQIKSLAENIAPSGAPANDAQQQQQQREMDLERFGVSEELKEFVNEITITTFQDFPLEGAINEHVTVFGMSTEKTTGLLIGLLAWVTVLIWVLLILIILLPK